jgi:hypothetical protein
VEWVDWLYAIPLNKMPAGPYENQESGASLLALLEVADVATGALSQRNNRYLNELPRGWQIRFRNTDDVYTYQMEWIENAYYQALRENEISYKNQLYSFEWMLAQALPDGAPLSYNYPFNVASASTAYLGAKLFDDPTMLWWAGQSLAYNERNESVYPRPYPGIEEAISINSQSPKIGSCLIYGNSGLPNQDGGLAPDKIVFRDGWEDDSLYVLLNLRFTGWHRYKATNSVSMIYKNGALVEERRENFSFDWLPKGRSVFRDKRIPRENMNGIIIEKTGLARIIPLLTGFGSIYLQNPPHYAEVSTFKLSTISDTSHTRLSEWQGWQHDRWIEFRHNNEPLLVIDHATGQYKNTIGIIWHTSANISEGGYRYLLRDQQDPVEMVLIPYVKENEIKNNPRTGSILYQEKNTNSLKLITLFLFDDWIGANFDLEETTLRVTQAQNNVTFTLPDFINTQE